MIVLVFGAGGLLVQVNTSRSIAALTSLLYTARKQSSSSLGMPGQ